MSELGLNSDYSDSRDSDDSCDRSSVDTVFTDNLHSSDESDVSYSDENDHSDCEDVHRTGGSGVRRRQLSDDLPRKIVKEEPHTYAPERWPPLLDFLFVFSSFVAAVVAAYFTIF